MRWSPTSRPGAAIPLFMEWHRFRFGAASVLGQSWIGDHGRGAGSSSRTTGTRISATAILYFDVAKGGAGQTVKTSAGTRRVSCRKFRDNAVRLQLHALAYNLANFMRTLALPKEVEHWSLTTLREKLGKIGAKVVRHGQPVTFQLT